MNLPETDLPETEETLASDDDDFEPPATAAPPQQDNDPNDANGGTAEIGSRR